MVIGNGIVGQHAAITADGLGANVFIMGRDERKFIEQVKSVSDNISFVKSTPDNIDMKVGVIKEIKDKENRVALTPNGAKALIEAGHMVLLEVNAGEGSRFGNQEYKSLGFQSFFKRFVSCRY